MTSGDTTEVSFKFTIDNFKYRPEKCTESLKSASFEINGPGDLKTKWVLDVFPKGKVESHEDYVGVFLNTKSEFKVTASFKLDIIDGAGKEWKTLRSNPKDFDITGVNCSWGMKNWLKRDELDTRPDLLPDGNLTIKCTVTVFGPEKMLSGSDTVSSNPDLTIQSQKQLGEQLGKVFSDKQLSDIKIQCDGQTFDCHMVILAAISPVFMAMIQSDMKEKETKIVTIDDFKAEVVAEMLNFIYTGNISSHDAINEIATELLAAADKYSLDLLKTICEERLCSILEATNCVEYLVLGEMYQTFKLRRRALEVAVENVDSIMDTDVFKDLFKQKPELAWEVMKASHNK